MDPVMDPVTKYYTKYSGPLTHHRIIKPGVLDINIRKLIEKNDLLALRKCIENKKNQSRSINLIYAFWLCVYYNNRLLFRYCIQEVSKSRHSHFMIRGSTVKYLYIYHFNNQMMVNLFSLLEDEERKMMELVLNSNLELRKLLICNGIRIILDREEMKNILWEYMYWYNYRLFEVQSKIKYEKSVKIMINERLERTKREYLEVVSYFYEKFRIPKNVLDYIILFVN